jgi:hypothetical protein
MAQLGRSTLLRQLLLDRADVDAVDAVEAIAALQAQEPASPYVALWTRIKGFHPSSLDRAVRDRHVVKATLMRVTVHLVSASDYARFLPALLPMLRDFWRRTQAYRLERAGIDELARAALRFASEPRSMTELRDHLARIEPAVAADELWWRVRRHAPFVHAPTGEAWSYGRRPSMVAARAWLADQALDDGDPIAEQAAVRHLVSRYLAAFGPASAADISRWSGLPVSRLRPALEELGDLVRYRDEAGRILLDLPGRPLPAGDEPAPPRLLPMWDSVLLAHADRRRIISDEHRRLVIARNGDTLPTFLVDGRVAGLWWAESDSGGRSRIVLEPFGRLPHDARAGLEREAENLAALLEQREPTAYARYRRHTRARSAVGSTVRS